MTSASERHTHKPNYVLYIGVCLCPGFVRGFVHFSTCSFTRIHAKLLPLDLAKSDFHLLNLVHAHNAKLHMSKGHMESKVRTGVTAICRCEERNHCEGRYSIGPLIQV